MIITFLKYLTQSEATIDNTTCHETICNTKYNVTIDNTTCHEAINNITYHEAIDITKLITPIQISTNLFINDKFK